MLYNTWKTKQRLFIEIFFFRNKKKNHSPKKNYFWNFMKWGLKGEISIYADSGPTRYVLWCCGCICHKVLTFFQIDYSENQIFCFLKSRILTCCIFRNKTFFICDLWLGKRMMCLSSNFFFSSFGRLLFLTPNVTNSIQLVTETCFCSRLYGMLIFKSCSI